MTQEQKAKAYDEALDRAKKEWSNNLDGAYKNYRERLETIFPELAESEDEKIRKKIIYLVKKSHEQGGYALHEYEADEMLAWLEKQGEQNPADNVEPKFLESAWSEEDVAYIDELTDFFEHCGELHQPQEKVVKWLKSLKQRIGE